MAINERGLLVYGGTDERGKQVFSSLDERGLYVFMDSSAIGSIIEAGFITINENTSLELSGSLLLDSFSNFNVDSTFIAIGSNLLNGVSVISTDTLTNVIATSIKEANGNLTANTSLLADSDLISNELTIFLNAPTELSIDGLTVLNSETELSSLSSVDFLHSLIINGLTTLTSVSSIFTEGSVVEVDISLSLSATGDMVFINNIVLNNSLDLSESYTLAAIGYLISELNNQIINSIHLQGNREMTIKLKGSRDLVVKLKGLIH